MSTSTSTQPINIWHPRIHHTSIVSKSHLRTLIHTEYPHLTQHPKYPKFITDAERHLNIITQLQDKTHLNHGDIAHLAHTLGITRTIIYRHVRQALKPRLYWFLENAISKTQARHHLIEIHKTNTNIHSLTDLQERLHTYYPAQFLQHARGQPDRLIQCKKYFQILSLLAEGGHNYTDLAAQVSKTVTNIKEWCTSQTRPGLLNLARRIPTTPTKPGHQWLPLTMQGRFHPTHFIQVPTTNTNWNQIPPVLQQLTPLTNPSMTYWHQQFGPITQDEAFAYLLGNLVSDAGKITPHYTSTRLELNLTKNYTWSKQLGDAVCYYLGHLRIHAEYKTSSQCHRWRSQNSAFLTWMKFTCLDLKPGDTTTFTPINSLWLLSAPRNIRLKFLQGLNDGDGYVNTKYQKIGNACGVNSDFILRLLSSLGVESRINGPRVVIEQQASIIHAAELPYFLHANGRQEEAYKLAEMMGNRMLHTREPITNEIGSFIKTLKKQGKSIGEITERVFDKFNICYYPRRIRIFLKDEGANLSKQ